MPFSASRHPTAKIPASVDKARAHFNAAGWSYRSAAKELGVSYQHLFEVLTARRHSSRLMAAVLALPQRKALRIASLKTQPPAQ